MSPQSRKTIPLDRGILFVVILLFGIGLVQVYSASFLLASEVKSDGFFFFNRQLLFTILSVGLLIVVAHIKFEWIERRSYWLWLIAGLGVMLTLVPGIGQKAGGAARWIRLPMGFQFEPAELIKLSLACLLASLLTPGHGLSKTSRWLKFFLLCAPLGLLLKQPDFGSFAICVLVVLTVSYVFGLRLSYLLGAGLVSMLGFYFLVMNVPYRRARVLSFLDPWKDAERGGFQIIQSLVGYHSGGLTGVGLGEGQAKLFFLPEAHTDFTASVLAEETGLIGLGFVMLLYSYLVIRGFKISYRVEDRFARILGLGLTTTFALQVGVNFAVSMGLLPTKGLTLPFLSYGGSSLVSTAVIFGLLLNIQRTFR